MRCKTKERNRSGPGYGERQWRGDGSQRVIGWGLVLGVGCSGTGWMTGSGKSMCLGNVFGKGFQGFGFGE